MFLEVYINVLQLKVLFALSSPQRSFRINFDPYCLVNVELREEGELSASFLFETS